ncbi:thiamine phosphate synthase [Laribacter hongkongensis]|uniref:thiamine phosphate synthase n=1 Tax=Laribacter hongkongensis TaxID=168471 RepID=UPI001EFDEC54|nr:thiamine phosphate synthase [Laribacter hongkongensis]MCG9072035.1 thiamine phosphate synthase [Laribacter hongkongensis]
MAATSLPTVGIGGITPANAGAVFAAGVDGVAVVSAICTAADPAAVTRELYALKGHTA